MNRIFHYILFYKPYGVLSQFTSEGKWKSLKDFGPFPSTVYAAGRLDADSEGLLFLTNDNALKHRLTDPTFEHSKTYLVQVERCPGEADLEKLRNGFAVNGILTKPAEVLLLTEEPVLPPRAVPIRFRKNVPTSWIQITIREGRNRQVRRMTAAIGYPTLRLVRSKFGILDLAGLTSGKHRSLQKSEIDRLKRSVASSAL